MSEQAEHRDDEATEPENYGSLNVEDDPDGTEDPADLAGTATSEDTSVGYQPSTGEPCEQ
jgi:hypothetical protein